MRILFTLAAASALVAFAADEAASRRCSCMGRAGFDAAKAVTLTGTAGEITDHTHGRMTGKHMNLKTETETIEVHLGPAAFLEREKFGVVQGDRVEIAGSRMKMGDKDVIIARSVKRGDMTWTLRSETGVPRWSGGGGKRKKQ